jgi:protoporphyrinogen oxidase
LGLLDKLRLGATIVYASRVKNWQKLERIPVTDWLQRWSGSRTFEQIWLPLLRAKLGESYTQTSAAFIWATIARMYAARRSGMKRETFGYVPGGYARILAAFAAVLSATNVCIKVRHVVQHVAPTGNGRIRMLFTSGQQETFDQVVLTLPGPIAAQVCPGLSANEASRLQGIQYQGILCASVLLQQPLTHFYVTNITDNWVPFTAVIDMSTLVDRVHFGGKSLVYLPKYVTPDDPAWSLSDQELEVRFLAALAQMYPHFHPDHVLCFRVSRVRYVFAIPTLHYSKQLPPMATSIPGVHIVNSAHILNGTLNANETIRLAEQTAARLLTMPG